MEKPTSQLVEEAVLAVKQGEISLETGATRFGTAWLEIKGEVALILDLEKAGQSFKSSLPAPNLNKMWLQILPDLTLVEMLPVNGSETNHDKLAQPNIVKVTRPEAEKTPGKPAAPVKAPEPINLTARKSAWEKWRKPLVWAAAIVLIMVISLSSLVGVANAAEPGDFFYGTKLWLDSARQVVAFSPQDKRNFAISYCNNRSEEMEYLVKNNKLQYFADVAGDYQKTLQQAFTGNTTALSSEQASQLKAQQTRLTQLSGQLSSVNAAGASQASANVDKLVQQISTYQKPGDISPVPTTTPGTSTPSSLTPSVSPGTATPGVSVTANITGTVTISGTASPSVTNTVLPAPVVTPAITPTVAVTGEISPTIEISGTIVNIPGTPGLSVVAPPASTPTPTPAAGDSGSSVVLSYNPTPNPTQVVADNDGVQENDNDADDSTGNSQGDGDQQNKGQHNNLPAPTPPAKGKPPTATPTEVPVPTPTPTTKPVPTPTPVPTTQASGGNNGNGNGNDKEPKATKTPKTEKPTDTPKPTKMPKPDKTKKP